MINKLVTGTVLQVVRFTCLFERKKDRCKGEIDMKEKIRKEFFRIFGTIIVVSGIIFIYAGSVFSLETKTAAAVLDLEAKEGVSVGLASTISDYLRTQLVNTNKFTIVTRENMESILREQKLQLSGCTSQECIVEMGQLLGVHKMFTGSIGKVGTIFLVNLKIIDVQSGRIEKAESSEESRSEEELLAAMRRLAKIMAGLSAPAAVNSEPDLFTVKEKSAQEPYTTPYVTEKAAASYSYKPSANEIGFIDVFTGFDNSTMDLEFSRSSPGLTKSELGLSGSFSDGFSSIAWKDLGTYKSTPPIGFRIGCPPSVGWLYVEFFYSSYAIAEQSTDFWLDGIKQGTFDFTTNDYFKVDNLTLGMGLLPFIRIAGPSNIYFGAGLNFNLSSWEAPTVKGYTQSSSFSAPSSDSKLGLGFVFPVGARIFFSDFIGLVIEGRYSYNFFTFTRDIENEGDKLELNAYQLLIGMSFAIK
jgi:hypothetical protein